MELTFRLAKLSDLHEICILYREVTDTMISSKINQWDELYPTQEDFRSDIRKKQLTIVEYDSKMIAAYTLNQECDEKYQSGKWTYHEKPYFVIHRLCVSPVFQHQGMAKEILLHIERESRSLGVHSIRLDVFTENPYAVKLYRNAGYYDTGMVTWRKGDFLLMEKNF